MAAPKSLNIRTYNVGFGDCFLLSFRYAGNSEKHVLIDFGSMAGAAGGRMMKVANDIKSRSGEKLTAVVATHRHRDHVSGFATKNGKGTGDVIRALKPDLVLQPWTEDPDVAVDATEPKKAFAASRRRVRRLGLMHEVAAGTVLESKRTRHFDGKLKAQLSFIGEDNIKNPSAVRNLMTMGTNEYLHAGKTTKLATKLGVKIHVLGPPTVEQHGAVKSQTDEDPEFWKFQAGAMTMTAKRNGGALFPNYVASRGPNFPVAARWLIHRARLSRGDQLLQIVRALDDAMNNTSLILLFEVGTTRLLFPGDAQIENWQYALKQKKHEARLNNVTLYKVGHHGSLNATPKSLWKRFKNRSPDPQAANRMTSLLSTLLGPHGHEESGTEVPRSTLVTALKKDTNFFTTQDLTGDAFFHDTQVDF
jgi:hypothetical protein